MVVCGVPFREGVRILQRMRTPALDFDEAGSVADLEGGGGVCHDPSKIFFGY